MSEFQILSKVESPADIKSLTQKELNTLAKEIREFLIDNVSKTGGHFSSNMGIVELTIALHRVFDSPKDKLIFDVGHQCYPHKILTGRKDMFSTNRQLGGMSGFTRRYESKHDFIDAGHASTSISSAMGILLGEELQGQFNYIIPIIGDASLTGGMAYEALNHLGHIKKKMIVILNDNNMSIDSSVGAISSKLSKMTTTKSYQAFKHVADWTMLHIPFVGKAFYASVMRWKKSVKTLFYKTDIFTDLGLKYIGPIDGHNIQELQRVLNRVKLLDEPVLLHVITKKGKGYPLAEKRPGDYHGVKPFDPKVGVVNTPGTKITYTNAFANTILINARKNNKIVAITAAMMSGTGLSAFFKEFPKRSFDVGITEEHAVTLASGMAISGLKPVVAIYSTFIQRGIDQIIHDISIPGLSVIFALDRAGIVPADGEAHQGIFDISLLKSIPGITIMAPSTANEMSMMFDHALTLKGPSVIRYSKDYVIESDTVLDSPLVPNRGVLFSKNKFNILIICYGELLSEAKEASSKLEDKGFDADIYSLRFITPLDTKVILNTIKSYNMIVILEDGVITGGVGQDIKCIAGESQKSIYVLGVDNNFLTHGTRAELKKMCKLDSDSIVKYVIEKSDEVRHKQVVERIKSKW
ncbi:MAG: 1-deoxy-D-xylulose-5-phosphate synthase [Spirochaetaceae bacterium]